MQQQDGVSIEVLTRIEPLTEADYSNHEAVKEKLHSYQNKIAELYQWHQPRGKVVKRQHKQNEYLKQELKQLNASLTSVLEKSAAQKPKPAQPREGTVSQHADVARKQLDNLMKQINNYKRETERLKMKLEAALPARIQALESELRLKDSRIEELSGKVKTLERMDKIYQKSDITKLEKELNTKVSSLTQELAFNRKKIETLQRTQQVISESAEAESDKPKKLQRRSLSTVGKGVKFPIASQQPSEKTVDNQEVERLRSNIEVLEYAKTALSKKLKVEVEFWQAKCKKLQDELQSSRDRLSSKQKQSNIVMSRFNELKRRATVYTLEPLDRNSDMPAALISDKRREFKGVLTANKDLALKRFDDTEKLNIGDSYSITKISFRWREDRIVFMSAEYTTEGGKLVSSNCFGTLEQLESGTLHYNRIDLELHGSEYVNSVQGYHNGRHIGIHWMNIEYLKFGTSRNQNVHIGSDRNQAKSKKFSFDITGHEKPVALMGTTVRPNPKQPEYLITIGLQLRRKDTNLKHSNVHRSREPKDAANTSIKSPPRLTNDSAANDKNP